MGRNLHIHPACWVGARYEEEVRGWDGVMQSYYVDEWERQGILLAKASGETYNDIGKAAGVTAQRVQQIVKDAQ